MILSGCRFVLENSMSNFVSLCVCANVCVCKSELVFMLQ